MNYFCSSEQMSKIGEISTDYKQHTGEVGKQIKIMNVSRFNQEEQASSLFQSIMQKQKVRCSPLPLVLEDIHVIGK